MWNTPPTMSSNFLTVLWRISIAFTTFYIFSQGLRLPFRNCEVGGLGSTFPIIWNTYKREQASWIFLCLEYAIRLVFILGYIRDLLKLINCRYREFLLPLRSSAFDFVRLILQATFTLTAAAKIANFRKRTLEGENPQQYNTRSLDYWLVRGKEYIICYWYNIIILEIEIITQTIYPPNRNIHR